MDKTSLTTNPLPREFRGWGRKKTDSGKRNNSGRPTADELERRKARIMEVARDMFVSRGYAATTLLDIARKSGVATRTVYQHFGDKESIFHEVIFARNAARIEPPSYVIGEGIMTTLDRAARYVYDFSLRPRSIELMRLMIAESSRFPELMTQVATTIFSRFKSNVASLFQEMAEHDLIPHMDHHHSASLFIDLLLGNRTVMIYFGWSISDPIQEDITVKIDLFMRGRFGRI